MADAVASQTILDGERLFIAKFTNISDGTGETGALKIDVSTLNRNASGNACNGVKINKIYATTFGMEVRILWDATTDVFAWMLPTNSNYLMDLSSFGGIPNNAGAGVTGDVLFTTTNAAAGDMYTIVLEFIKTYANPQG
jgi:hypothetical protein